MFLLKLGIMLSYLHVSALANSVTSIGDYAFICCDSLTSITIPNSVTSIGYEAFSSCDSLTSITIPNSVTSIGYYAFVGCESLESMSVASGNTVYHSAGNCIIETNSKTLIAGCKNSVIPSDGSVTSIGDNVFENCDSLTSITIPNSVTCIGDYAFFSCESLTSITIPDSVTSIGEYAFSHCSILTSITIPNSVTSIGDAAFFYCENLTSITIPNSVTSIGNAAFYGCYALLTVYNLSELPITAGSSAYGYVGYYAENIYSPCENHTGGEANCTNKTVCEICFMEYGEVDTSKHTYELFTKIDPDCENIGYEIYQCSACNNIKSLPIKANGHKLVYSHKLAATHTEPAKNVYKCEICDSEIYKEFGFALCDFNEDGLLSPTDFDQFNSETADVEAFDFNENNSVDDIDITIIRHITNNTSVEEIADVNGDGTSDLRDLVRAKKILAGYELPGAVDRDFSDKADADDLVFIVDFVMYFKFSK